MPLGLRALEDGVGAAVTLAAPLSGVEGRYPARDSLAAPNILPSDRRIFPIAPPPSRSAFPWVGRFDTRSRTFSRVTAGQGTCKRAHNTLFTRKAPTQVSRRRHPVTYAHEPDGRFSLSTLLMRRKSFGDLTPSARSRSRSSSSRSKRRSMAIISVREGDEGVPPSVKPPLIFPLSLSPSPLPAASCRRRLTM